jgi:hypothetical protein
MKKKERKVLKEKLTAAVKKVLATNNAILTAKIEKAVKKSINQIVKKSKKKIIAKKKAGIAKK